MTKFRMEKAVRELIVKYKTFSPKELRDLMLTEYNVKRTPESIIMLFKRHPEMLEVLKAEVRVEDQEHENIKYEPLYWLDPKTWKSQIPIIQKWVDTMIFRKVKNQSIKRRVNVLRAMCQGLKGKDQIKEWKIHPLALTEERAIEFLTELNKRNVDDTPLRLVVRNYLIFAKGEVPTRISGEVIIGKMATEYFSDGEVDRIFYTLDQEGDKVFKRTVAFLWLSMTRIKATCKTKGPQFKEIPINGHKFLQVTVFDKGKKGKERRDKLIMPKLQHILEECGGIVEDMFPYRPDELRNKLKDLYKRAGITKEIQQPAHIWRHTGAMFWLRRSGWNYTLVCNIGGWTEDKILRKCYGVPEMKDLVKFAMELN